MQYWMSRNLRTTRYRDGSAIAADLNNISWTATTSGAYGIYNNSPYTDATVNNNIYGKLYNFFAVSDARGLCPVGTHVPTIAEWTSLANGRGNGVLKEAGHSHWQTDFGEGNNATGFTAIPGGGRDKNGEYVSMGSTANWWSTSEISLTTARSALMWADDLFMGGSEKASGFSVRCLAD
jgi:uncharacterized protein (TIGR02145 family)